MNSWMLAGAILVALFFLLKLIFASGGKVARVSYQKRDFLFTPDERAFLNVLDEAVGSTHRIFGKIPVADLLIPRNLDKDPEARRIFDEMEDRRFSFVVCDKDSLTIICALQLDDVTPGDKSKKRGGDPLLSLCEGAGLPLIRVSSHNLQDPSSLRELIQSSIKQDSLFTVESDGRREPKFSNFEGLDI